MENTFRDMGAESQVMIETKIWFTHNRSQCNHNDF